MRYIELAEILKDNEHTRACLFPELRQLETIKKDVDFAAVYRQREQAAERYLTQPIQALPYSKYKLFDTTGDRSEYDDLYMEHRWRMNTLAFMALFAEDGARYLPALQDAIWAILDEYTWTPTAHLFYRSLDYYNAEGKPWHHRVIDLFAAETCQTLSEIVYVLGDRLDKIVVDRICDLCEERMLSTYETLRAPLNWEMGASNWTAVCAGSMGMSAIYLVKDSERLARILQRTLDHMDFYMDGFADDGASAEGVGYWMYGMTYFVSFAELLYQRTNGKVSLYDNPKVEKVANFLTRAKLYGNTAANFADCNPEFVYREGIIHRLKKRFPDTQVPSGRYKMQYPESNMLRWAGFIRDLAWRRDDYRTDFEVCASSYCFEDVQWYVSNREYEGHWYSFAVKGGNNAESHNHNDIGHFIYQIDGEAFFIDMGPGKYTKDYFGAKRYESIFTASSGHSVPMIDGQLQPAGEQYRARAFAVNGDAVTIDLSDAYEAAGDIVREMCFSDEGAVTLKDRFTTSKEVVERFVVACCEPPSVAEGGVWLKNSKNEAVLRFDPSVVVLEDIQELDGFYKTEGIKKYLVDFRLKTGTAEAIFEISRA